MGLGEPAEIHGEPFGAKFPIGVQDHRGLEPGIHQTAFFAKNSSQLRVTGAGSPPPLAAPRMEFTAPRFEISSIASIEIVAPRSHPTRSAARREVKECVRTCIARAPT